jgi:hypothetical protein
MEVAFSSALAALAAHSLVADISFSFCFWQQEALVGGLWRAARGGMILLRALRAEAATKQEPTFVYVRCARLALAVHAPIAAHHSELVRAAIDSPLGSDSTGPLTFDVEGGSGGSEAALARLVAWMYGCREEASPKSIQDAVESLHVASFMHIPPLQRECSAYIESWIDAIVTAPYESDANVRQCVDLYATLSATDIEGPTEAVRVGLMRMIAQRSTDPVVSDLIGGCSLETLVRLTAGACMSLSVDLALMWQHHQAQQGNMVSEVLAHIQVGALPACFVDSLLSSGRLTEDEERRVAQRVKLNGRAKRPALSFGWAGSVGGGIRAIALSAAFSLVWRKLGAGPGPAAPAAIGRVIHTSQVVVVDGRAFSFGVIGRSDSDPGHVFDAESDKWVPFGILPPSIAQGAQGQFDAVVYKTTIFFVRMTGIGASCVAFHVPTCTWSVLPEISAARQWPCIAIVDKHLYIIGGRPASPASIQSAPTERICLETLEETLDETLGPGDGGYQYTPRHGQWESIGSPIARYRSAAAVVDGSIFVSGGFHSGQEPRSVSSALTRIDPEAGTVEEMGAMGCARAGHGSFASSGQIVVLGGAHPTRTYSPRVSARFSSAERFDTATRTWHALSAAK